MKYTFYTNNYFYDYKIIICNYGDVTTLTFDVSVLYNMKIYLSHSYYGLFIILINWSLLMMKFVKENILFLTLIYFNIL